MQLSEALDRVFMVHAGEVLTDEAMQNIRGFLMWSSLPEDRSIKPDRFKPMTYGDVTFQVERMSDLVDEIKPLHVAHWNETEKHRHGQSLSADYAAFVASERAGQYVLFTTRKDGLLIGNCACYLHRSTHTQRLVATEDTLFVLKAHRSGRMGIEFFKYCERVLTEIGASEVRLKVSTTNAVDKMLQRQGYEFTAHELSKQLGERDDATQH